MFKTLRKSKGITQMELAQKLGIAQPTVSCWESGTATPTVLAIKKIADVLEVDTSEVLNCFIEMQKERKGNE